MCPVRQASLIALPGYPADFIQWWAILPEASMQARRTQGLDADEEQPTLDLSAPRDHEGTRPRLESERDAPDEDPPPGDVAQGREVGGRAPVAGAGEDERVRAVDDPERGREAAGGDEDLEPRSDPGERIALRKLKTACVQRLNEHLGSMSLDDYQEARWAIEGAVDHATAREALTKWTGDHVRLWTPGAHTGRRILEAMR